MFLSCAIVLSAYVLKPSDENTTVVSIVNSIGCGRISYVRQRRNIWKVGPLEKESSVPTSYVRKAHTFCDDDWSLFPIGSYYCCHLKWERMDRFNKIKQIIQTKALCVKSCINKLLHFLSDS